jgi:hypothetical protein
MHLSKLLIFSAVLLPGFLFAQSSGKYLKRLTQADKVLYFIRPIELKSAQDKLLLVPDFTYNYSKEEKTDATITFTVLSKTPVKTVDSLRFAVASTGEVLSSSQPVTFMYMERKKGKWESRFNATLPFRHLMAVLEKGGDIRAELFSSTQKYLFPAGRKWEKAARIVFEIFSAEIDNSK